MAGLMPVSDRMVVTNSRIHEVIAPADMPQQVPPWEALPYSMSSSGGRVRPSGDQPPPFATNQRASAAASPGAALGLAKWYAPRNMPTLAEPLYCWANWLRLNPSVPAVPSTDAKPDPAAHCAGQLTFSCQPLTSWPRMPLTPR